MRQLFLFWQFNGDNTSFCNLHCPYCYEQNKTHQHHWNGKIGEWEQAFISLKRDIYFVFSYGEALGSHGFYECVDMIGRHPTWTLNIITNLSYNLERLLKTHLVKDGRLFVTASWHPLGHANKKLAWRYFKKHLLQLKKAKVPVHVTYAWYRPQIGLFPKYFDWLDKHGFRVTIRRIAQPQKNSLFTKLQRRIYPGKNKLTDYCPEELACLYACVSSKTAKYNLNMHTTHNMKCTAGKDLILVEHDGTVKLCADCYGNNHKLGNIFDKNFKLHEESTRCPINSCGGCYGMLHLEDKEFGDLPDRLWNDTFLSQAENQKTNTERFKQCLQAIR